MKIPRSNADRVVPPFPRKGEAVPATSDALLKFLAKYRIDLTPVLNTDGSIAFWSCGARFCNSSGRNYTGVSSWAYEAADALRKYIDRDWWLVGSTLVKGVEAPPCAART